MFDEGKSEKMDSSITIATNGHGDIIVVRRCRVLKLEMINKRTDNKMLQKIYHELFKYSYG